MVSVDPFLLLLTLNAALLAVSAGLLLVRRRGPDRQIAAAHAELARRKSFTDAVLETVEVGIVSCDADGIFVVSNRAERAMFGLDRPLQGLPAHELAPRIEVFTPEGRALSAEDHPLLRALRGEDVSRVEVLAGPVGGPHRRLVVRGRQIIGPDGDVIGAVAALTDVTAEHESAGQLVEERRRLTQAQRIGQVGSFELEVATGAWTFSEHVSVLWGLAPGDITAARLDELLLDEDREDAVTTWRNALRDGGMHSYDVHIRRAVDGERRLLRTTVEVTHDRSGQAVHVRGVHLDITDLTRAEQAAHRAGAFFEAVLTATPDDIVVTDVTTGAVVYHSAGRRTSGPGGTAPHPTDDLEGLAGPVAGAAELQDGQVAQVVHRRRRADGDWRWVNRRVTPFRRDDSGRVVEVLAIVRDVTDVVEAEQQLVHAAQHDHLTNLPNRAVLVRRLSAALARSEREGREVAVLFCDLDGFKHVNDTGGHSAGDAVLVEAARRLLAVVREGDLVARVGGDEFVIVVEPGGDQASSRDGVGAAGDSPPSRLRAVQLADRLLAALRLPVRVEGADYVVTASIGIAYPAPGSGLTADQVLHHADAAMYRAKERGKNALEVATAPALVGGAPRPIEIPSPRHDPGRVADVPAEGC